MAFKFVVFAAVVAVARAGIIGAPAGLIGAPGLIGARAGLIGAPGLVGAPGLIGARAGLIGAPTVLSQGALASPLLAPRLAAPIGAPLLAPRLAAPLAAPIGAQVLAAPIAKVAAPLAAVDTDYDPNPAYSYAYDVQDALTGDSKNQQETRQGDVVQGSYSLTEPDGTRRTVDYTADPINGFNAVVRREPLAIAKTVVAAPAVAPVAAYAAAPVVSRVASPYGLAAPLGYASPLAARTILG